VTGHHNVRIFWISTTSSLDLVLPVGWKPFGTIYESDGSGLVGIVARRWFRAEQSEA